MNILKEITTIIKQLTRKLPPDDDADLFSTGILDSLNMARLIVALEQNFKIEIDMDDIIPENFINVTAICNLVAKYMDGKK